MSSANQGFSALHAETGKPLQLVMQRLWLTGQVLPAGARLRVRHVFTSAEPRPLEIIYVFPLPRDAALRRFRISGEGFDIHSELRSAADALASYESAVAAGQLGALARQHGDGLIDLTVGNIRPGETVEVDLELLAGVELRDDGFRFFFPFTLAPSYHPQARAVSVTSGEGQIELPADLFGDLILPPFHRDASALHQVGFDLIAFAPSDVSEIASPSHALRIGYSGARQMRVSLTPAGDVPDRDLVLDVSWKDSASKKPEPYVLTSRSDSGHLDFAALVPSTSFGVQPDTPRRVVFLLDASGSMQGQPFQQAQKAILACLGALSDRDLLGLITFANATESLHSSLLPATVENRDRARRFLAKASAGGGTELLAAAQSAAQLLAGPGDVLILTDGQVLGTEAIVAAARATGTRLHCLGIGSASQDRFLTQLARATGGASRVVMPNERVDLAAVDLFASISCPVASGLKTMPSTLPDPPATVYAGTPVLLYGRFDVGSEPVIQLTWNENGRLRLPVPPEATQPDDTIRLLRGARLIADCEMLQVRPPSSPPLQKRFANRASAHLKRLSEEYSLASREMSLIAVVKRNGDRPGDLPETRLVPVGVPPSAQWDAYFAPPASAELLFATFMAPAAFAMPVPPASPQPPSRFSVRSVFGHRTQSSPPPPAAKPSNPEDALMDLAARLEPDGGMPGDGPNQRALASVYACLAFISQKHTTTNGAFRSHLARLTEFLTGLETSLPEHRLTMAAVIERAHSGTPLPGDWIAQSQSWQQVAQALQGRLSERESSRLGHP